MPGCRAEYAVSWGKEFLSTPSARRATRRIYRQWYLQGISIHALREEGDPPQRRQRQAWIIFLSTPSARRATLEASSGAEEDVNFYPRPPRGGRPAVDDRHFAIVEFLSTPSARRTTPHYVVYIVSRAISIHALREEGDMGWSAEGSGPEAISIHALREEGDYILRISKMEQNRLFLSTPSARRATPSLCSQCTASANFYPRPPRGGRQATVRIPAAVAQFLSTPSARRAT